MAASFPGLSRVLHKARERNLASEPKANTAPDNSIYSSGIGTAPPFFHFSSMLFTCAHPPQCKDPGSMNGPGYFFLLLLRSA